MLSNTFDYIRTIYTVHILAESTARFQPVIVNRNSLWKDQPGLLHIGEGVIDPAMLAALAFDTFHLTFWCPSCGFLWHTSLCSQFSRLGHTKTGAPKISESSLPGTLLFKSLTMNDQCPDTRHFLTFKTRPASDSEIVIQCLKNFMGWKQPTKNKIRIF